uniref:histidine kinase n=1 Tax=Dunaliella tertiolecta TaxID=3047 RepID=A0A7S3VS63_DUNTE
MSRGPSRSCSKEGQASELLRWKSAIPLAYKQRNFGENVQLVQSTFFAGCAFVAYFLLGSTFSTLFPGDPAALQLWGAEVPLILSQMSATAFFTAMVLNMTSFLFEDSVAKRQLALLSCTIKAAACYSDLLLATGQLPIIFDAHGALLIPQRYVQWAVTTPLMVLVLSKLSDFAWQRTAIAMGADVMMVFMGFASHLLPHPWHWIPFGLSTCLFVFVMYELGCMVASAIKESANESANSRRSLVFIYICTLLIWSLFPVAWLTTYFNPTGIFINESLIMFANFGAKVLFSSSIMYGNYITIGQRRVMARLDLENKDRIQMITDLKEAVSRKDQFMSLMSHELRTPLNGIIQLGDALCRGAGGELNPKGQHFLRTIKNSSNHLLNIINDILDVAALKEGKLTIKHEAVNLSKAVEHVCDIVSPLAKKEVAIERRTHPGTPLIVGDFSRIVQILYNLMGNSLKFTQRGLVRVTVAPADKLATHVIITVEDTGIGISQDKIPHIWGAFEQVDMSVTRKYGGTGLGLNIVKQLVNAHEGEIQCKSKEGKGTAFTMRLPVMQAGRAIRPSLEAQIQQSVESLGYDFSVVRRSLSARSGSLNGSFRASSVVDGSRSNTGELLVSGNNSTTNLGANSTSQGQTFTGISDCEEESERIIKRRTKELENEALMNDLARRTDHKRSMDSEECVGHVMAQQQLRQRQRRSQQESPVNSTVLGEKLAYQRQLMQNQEALGLGAGKKHGLGWQGPHSLEQVQEAPSSESCHVRASMSNHSSTEEMAPKHNTMPLPTTQREPLSSQVVGKKAHSSSQCGAMDIASGRSVVPVHGHAGRLADKSEEDDIVVGGSGGNSPPFGFAWKGGGNADKGKRATSTDPASMGRIGGLGSRARRASSSLLMHGKAAATSFFGTLFPNATSSQASGQLDDEPVDFGAPLLLMRSSSEEADAEDPPVGTQGEPSKVRWNISRFTPLPKKGEDAEAQEQMDALQRQGQSAQRARSDSQFAHWARRTVGSATPTTCSNMSRYSLDAPSTASGAPSLRPGRNAPSHTSMDSGSTQRSTLTRKPMVARSASNVASGLSMEKLAYSNMYGSAQILSVDDEEVNQIVLEEILTCAGYQYARAMDGDEAMEWLLLQETLPDLILLDCMMPNMSGHEFCAQLRQHIPGTVLPVIMVSAKSNEDNIVEGLRSGSNDFIRKPYQREELLARIETQLRLKNDSWWLAELMNNQDGRETESMKLLKNILPESIIQRMQSGQKFVADSHQHVVILFSDIVGFTRLSSKLPTAEIFLMLSNMFNAFDKLTDRFSVYKVETIGDAYMVAAGHDEDDVKKKKGAPVERVLRMAKGMMDVVQNITAPNGERLRIRIGVHCGPAFAGVIGSKCPRYCFLGDTVNTASRMESMSFPMCIQVSAAVHHAWPEGHSQLVQLEAREVKGKGKMTTYLLKHGLWEEGKQTLEKEQAEAKARSNAVLHKQQQQQQVSSQSNALEAGAKGAMANGVGIDAGSTAALQPPASPNVLSNGDKAPPEVNGVVTTTPRVTKPMTTLTKPWEKEDMEDDINLQPADTSGLFGDAAVNPLAQSHNSFLLQHDEDGPEDVKPVGPPQKGTRRIQKSGPPTRMSTRGSLREGALVSHGATHFGIHNINGSNSSPIPVTPNAAEGAANLELRDALQSQLDALQDRLLQAGREAASARDDASTQRKQARQLMEQLQLLEQRGGSFSTPNRSPSVSRSQIAQLRFGETTRHPSLDHGRPPPWVTDARSHWVANQPPSHANGQLLPMPPSQPAQDPSSSRAQVALAQSQSPAAYNPPTKNPPPMRINTAPPELEKPLTWVVSTSNSPSPNRAPGAAGAHTHSLGLGLGGGAALLAQASSGSNLLLPPLSLAHLFADLGLDGYLGRFEEEAVHLDMLLTMDFKQLDALGLRPLGHCIRVRESVLELAKGLLRMCEGRAAASSAGSKMRVVIPQDLET